MMESLRQRIEHAHSERHPVAPLCCTVLTTDETEQYHQRRRHPQQQQYSAESVGYEAIYIPPTNNDTPENDHHMFLQFPYNAFLASSPQQTENHAHDVVDKNDKKTEHGMPSDRRLPLHNSMNGAKRDILEDLLRQKTTSRVLARDDAPTPVHDNTTGVYNNIPSPPQVKRLRPGDEASASSPFSIFQAILRARSSSNANCAFTSPCQMSSLGVVDEEGEDIKEIIHDLFPTPVCRGRSRRQRSDMFDSHNKSLFDDNDDIIANEEIPSVCSTENSDESSTASIRMNQDTRDGGGQRIEQSLPKPTDGRICSSTQTDKRMESTSSETTAEQKDDAHLAFFLSPRLMEQDHALPLSCPDVSSSLSEPLRQWWGKFQRTSGMQLILARHASRQVPMSTPTMTTTTQPPAETILHPNNPTRSVHGQINEMDETENSSTEWNLPRDFLISSQIMTDDTSLSSIGSSSSSSSTEEWLLEVESAIQYFTDFQVPLHHDDGESELNLDDMRGDLESTLSLERIEKELLQISDFCRGDDISQDGLFLENYLGPVMGELSSILKEEFPSLEPDQPCRREAIMPSFVAGVEREEVSTQAVALCSSIVNHDKFLAIPPQLVYVFSTCVPVAKWTLTNMLAREAWLYDACCEQHLLNGIFLVTG